MRRTTARARARCARTRTGYRERLGKALAVANESAARLSEKTPPVIWVATAMCSFALGENVELLNRHFASDAFEIRAMNDTVGFRLFSTNYIRFYALYNSHTGVAKGMLSPAAERKFEQYLWDCTAPLVPLANAKRDPWHIHGSENHMVTNSVGNLLAAQFLKGIPAYADRKYADGSTAGQQYEAWRNYMSHWLDERVKHGQFEEYSSSYMKYTFIALLNLRDFSEDPVLRKKAEMFLDLYFASIAEETLATQLGGPKHRSKGHDRTFKPYKLLFNAPGGALEANDYLGNHPLATSDYYPPRPVVDLAKDTRGRGKHTFSKLAPIRRQDEPDSRWRILDKANPFVLNGFATSDYIMSSHVIDTTVESARMRAQLWEGIVFANDPMARIEIDGKNDEVTGKYITMPLKSIQDRNVMVTRKWGPVIDGGVDPHLRIKFLHSLETVEEDDGWIFVTSGDAFSALKVVEGGYAWNRPWKRLDRFNSREIAFITLKAEFSPIILLANDAADYNGDFGAFKAAVKAEPLEYGDGVLTFATITHEGLEKPGKIAGKAVESRPSRVFDSPFIRSERGSGVVYIRKGDEAMILDFSDPENPKKTVGVKPDERFPAGIGNANPIILGTENSPYLSSDYNSGVVTIRRGDETLTLDFNKPERW